MGVMRYIHQLLVTTGTLNSKCERNVQRQSSGDAASKLTSTGIDAGASQRESWPDYLWQGGWAVPLKKLSYKNWLNDITFCASIQQNCLQPRRNLRKLFCIPFTQLADWTVKLSKPQTDLAFDIVKYSQLISLLSVCECNVLTQCYLWILEEVTLF